MSGSLGTAASSSIAKSGQSCMLPQINSQQKDGGNSTANSIINSNQQNVVVSGGNAAHNSNNISVLEANRPTPIQAHFKKMNVEQHARDFPEYFNMTSDQTASVAMHNGNGGNNVPAINDPTSMPQSQQQSSHQQKAISHQNFNQSQSSGLVSSASGGAAGTNTA